MDGDTIDVLDSDHVKHRIRFLGIDAPEKAQPFGKVSKQVLSDHIFGREVEVEAQGNDRYGRLLGKILLNGVDQNLLQIKEGLAWHYAHYASNQFPGDADAYSRSEREARGQGIGLWNDADPVAPWEWRKSRKGRKAPR
ncbi:thermonuclease family protein [Holophaga foetida]|uniref:thermonuclease family protein n=1 Tax=Holophaga foetida TaxID=35839 RepID=UPI0002474CB6|nr:thermonuclease family protein [Holophaga foetida]